MWRVPQIWRDGEVWIIGGGPSMPRQFDVPDNLVEKIASGKEPMSKLSPYLSLLHNRHVIAINSAFKIGYWMDMLFFGDKGFFIANKREIAQFPNLKVTCSTVAHMEEYERRKVKYISRDRRTFGISDNPERVCWNHNSGAAAISVAANAGAKRIYLLGFDMKHVSERSHWHHDYNGKILNSATFKRHLLGWDTIAEDADKRGIEILNVSQESVLKEFKKVNLSDIL